MLCARLKADVLDVQGHTATESSDSDFESYSHDPPITAPAAPALAAADAANAQAESKPSIPSRQKVMNPPPSSLPLSILCP